MPEPSPENSEQRTQVRRNLFIAAALHGPDGSGCVVRIRNLSPDGALIEGVDLPDVGARVRLCRGSLNAPAQLVWHTRERAGLRFGTPLTVADWLPGGGRNRAQERVDTILFEWRAGGPSAPPESVPAGAADYAAFAVALGDAAEELMRDPRFVETHPRVLQAIDVAGDALRRLANLNKRVPQQGHAAR